MDSFYEIAENLGNLQVSYKRVPAQPVNATPYNQLPLQYFPSRINLYGGPQSKPNQGF